MSQSRIENKHNMRFGVFYENSALKEEVLWETRGAVLST